MASPRRKTYKNMSRLPVLIILAAVLVVAVAALEVFVPHNSSYSEEIEKQYGLIISEIMTDNTAAYPDETGKFGDWVEIYNPTDVRISLKDVSLSDKVNRTKFVFPKDAALEPGEYVTVFCDSTNRSLPDQVYHAKFKLNANTVNELYLFDGRGNQIDAVEYYEVENYEALLSDPDLKPQYSAVLQRRIPVLNRDESYIRVENEAWERLEEEDRIKITEQREEKRYRWKWVKTDDYSPGFPNTAEGHEAYLSQYTVKPGDLVINEVMPCPRSGITDGDGDLSDWLELLNTTDHDISLDGFCLSDNEQKPLKWIFPSGIKIGPGECFLVFCSGKDMLQTGTYPHTNFSINNESETLVLSTVTGQLIDRVTVAGVERDMSFGRDPKNLEVWRVFTIPTPGWPNTQESAYEADRYLRQINPTGVYLTEVMSSASQIKAFSDYAASDWVEIYNSSSQAWDMSGWGLSDNINWPHKWSFPQGITIQPGEYKVILLDGYEGANSNAARLRASFGLARAGSEMLTLSDASGRVLDRLYLPEIPTDISYGRTTGMNGFFYYDGPTPGTANGTGFRGFSQRPVFETPSGLYPDLITITLSASEGATIRYTTDGSIPTLENSHVYTDGIELADTALGVVIRARAFEPGLQPSDTATATYILKSNFTLDVVSLVCDPEELWNTTNGLLSEAPDLNRCTEVVKVGENGKVKLPFKWPVYRTYGKVDRQGYVEIFSQETGQAYISQGVKMDLMGDYSLDMPQKSFKIRAQAALGAKYFDYPLFQNEGRDYAYYKSFTLRNSGNDCVWTRVADGVQTRLIDKYLDSPILTLAWKPVIVFLNGEYWGHYNMRERKDRFSIAQHEGLDLDKDKEIYENMTILRAGWSVVQGSNKEYRAMLKEFEALSPNAKPEDLKYIYDHIDVESYIEWLAIKMFFGDSDPGNIMFYKLPGGKWKCLIFDLDYGLFNSEFNSPWSYLKKEGMGEKRISNIIFRKMIESDEIREKFLIRLGEIFQELTTQKMLDELKECTELIYPALKWHYQKWASHPDTRILNEESPSSADGSLRYWETRVNRMKNVMNKRPYFFWGFVKEQFGLSDADMIRYFGERPPNLGY